MAIRSRIWLFAATALIALSVSEHAAVERAQDVTGRWAGYFDSATNPGLRGALSIQISSQDGSRFAGEVCFPPGPCTPVMGTVSDSGEFTMTGRSSQVRSIEVHGRPFDRHSRIDRAIVAGYRIMRTGGALDQGNVVIVHQASGDGVPTDFAGMWGGEARPRGTAAARPIHVTFEIDRTGAITGNLGWSTVDARSGIVGQTTRSNDTDEIAVVGLLDDAIVVANVGPSVSVRDSRRLEGTYQLISKDGLTEYGRLNLLNELLKFQARSKQSEARANLKALYTTEKAFFQEKDRYSTLVNEVGYSPERNNRYRYVLTADPVSLELRVGPAPVSSNTDQGIDVDLFKYPQNVYPKITQGPCVGTSVWGIKGVGPYVFTGAAYGNVDDDDTLDVWTVSTADRWLSGQDCDAVGFIPAGEPANEINDVNK